MRALPMFVLLTLALGAAPAFAAAPDSTGAGDEAPAPKRARLSAPT